jgi:hypothetical protein
MRKDIYSGILGGEHRILKVLLFSKKPVYAN